MMHGNSNIKCYERFDAEYITLPLLSTLSWWQAINCRARCLVAKVRHLIEDTAFLRTSHARRNHDIFHYIMGNKTSNHVSV
jgi:ubiquinone biosynthesis protein Coq4